MKTSTKLERPDSLAGRDNGTYFPDEDAAAEAAIRAMKEKWRSEGMICQPAAVAFPDITKRTILQADKNCAIHKLLSECRATRRTLSLQKANGHE